MPQANKQICLFPEPSDHLEVSLAATTYFLLRAFLKPHLKQSVTNCFRGNWNFYESRHTSLIEDVR